MTLGRTYLGSQSCRKLLVWHSWGGTVVRHFWHATTHIPLKHHHHTTTTTPPNSQTAANYHPNNTTETTELRPTPQENTTQKYYLFATSHHQKYNHNDQNIPPKNHRNTMCSKCHACQGQASMKLKIVPKPTAAHSCGRLLIKMQCQANTPPPPNSQS